MREVLVKLADKFDQEGKHELANAVDGLLTTAARPKAPLKSLDEDVKKRLIKVYSQCTEKFKRLNECIRRIF